MSKEIIQIENKLMSSILGNEFYILFKDGTTSERWRSREEASFGVTMAIHHTDVSVDEVISWQKQIASAVNLPDSEEEIEKILHSKKV